MQGRTTQMERNSWAGKRYIATARQSQDTEGVASTQGQLEYMRRECATLDMSETDVVLLEGVTGSLPGRREDLTALLERRRTKKDFEVIVFHVVDRATRGGAGHGFWFEHECARVGLDVLFVGENLPDGPYSSVVKAAMYEAAHEGSVATGRRSAGGQTTAIASGMFRTAGRTPFGCHRAYFGGDDDRLKFVIRDLPDGRQEQLHPETGMVIGRFGTVGKKSRNRFRKQRNEYSLLIPGDPLEQRTVRIIYFLRYTRGWRGSRIAGLLNRHGRPAPCSGTWSQRQVESIYENEAYVGSDCMNRTYSGRFYRRDKVEGYVDLDRGKAVLATATHFQPVLMPRDQWHENDQPLMVDFLPRQVRTLAIVGQQELWDRRLDPTRPSRPYTAHPDSDYLLSNKLIAEQDKGALVGTLSGKRGDVKTPYYRHKRAKREKLRGSVYNILIPAKPLHEALMGLLGDVMVTMPNLRGRLIEEIIRYRQALPATDEGLHALRKERAELTEQINMTIRCLTGAAMKDAQVELERMGRRRNEIEADIKRIERSAVVDHADTPEQVADRLIADMRTIDLHRLAPEAVRHLVDLLVDSATVDMATKAVSFTVSLPEHALEATKGGLAMCPVASWRSSTGDQTHIVLAAAKCEYRWKRGSHTQPPCYACRRTAA
jgi:hypothetical protein